MRQKKERTYSGTLSTAVTDREIASRKVARKAAADGIVLLENNGVLPLTKDNRIALYGAGARFTMKGGTGSGDVNEREKVNIYEGLVAAGYTITSEAWLDEFDDLYRQSRIEWRDHILQQQKETGEMFFNVYSTNPYMMPCGRTIDDADVDPDTSTAIFVLSRIAGEGADRSEGKGDYQITDEEDALIASITSRYENVVVIINAGGPMDLSFADHYPVAAILQISQLGMEGGNAVADILSGKVAPSGKLTDTWAYHYEDYSNAASYSHCNGDVYTEKYEEGIYVGYRYFDTFDVKPRYPFGFGLTYTTFEIIPGTAEVSYEENPGVTIHTTVKNTGNAAGREVVQIYTVLPQGKLDKEYQRLCAFAKTPLINPGESCTVSLTFPIYQLASYSEEDSGWLLENGSYIVTVGNASDSTVPCVKLILEKDHLLEKTQHICPLQDELTELTPISVKSLDAQVPSISLDANSLPTKEYTYRTANTLTEDEAGKFTLTLSEEQKIKMVVGDPNKSQENSNLGSAGKAVPGAAGETSHCAETDPWNLPGIVTADGPAGIRLMQEYEVNENGDIMPQDFTAAVEGGFFSEGKPKIRGKETYHQYCTAFPIGTALAQSWDTELVEEVGRTVAVELEEFGVTLWLAPGMNLHRNPLCGRNFEYYSEDPLVTGMMAAAMTRGVQTGKGCGTTVKHFCCNSQEDNRMGSNSILSERTLRELYLRGFEIAVKTAQPMSIMSSYNLINGVHAANNMDTLTHVLRDEWNFKGFVMTDWLTTCISGMVPGGSKAYLCTKSGNDLIMPGEPSDYDSIRQALQNGSLTEDELNQACRNIINIVFQSLEYEDAESYSSQFQLKPYFSVQ